MIARGMKAVVVVALILTGCAPEGQPQGTARDAAPAGIHPNIVVILIDTLRADHLPMYGYRHNTAPFLSRLAESAVVFENAYSTSSWTAPATASLFTSLYPQQHGVVTGRAVTYQMRRKLEKKLRLNRIPEELETLPEAMKKAGYATWGVADNFNVCPQMGFADGFDVFVSDARHDRGGEYVNGILRGWRERLIGNTPYFLYIHYLDPHQPYHMWQPFYRPPAATPSAERPSNLADDQRLEQVALYDSEIGFVDLMIREAFRSFGWDRNTILVITSDHGEEFWDHGHVFHDKTLYEEMLHVPLLVHDSTGALHPGRIAESVGIIDILPTLTEIAGLPADPRAMGASLLPLMTHAEPPAPRARDLFAHLERTFFAPWGADNTLRAVEGREHYVALSARRGKLKLITDSRGQTRLFDLASDPGEKSDLSGAHPERVAALDAALKGFGKAMKIYATPAFEETLTPEEIERLRTLGYVE